MTQTDEELVLRCREGDERAWEAIVLRYQNLLFSIPRRAGLGKDLASDVLQDVFITLFQKIHHLEKPQFLRAWLTTTTRHKTIHLIQKEIRGKPAAKRDSGDDPLREVPDRRPLADDQLITLETENQIEEAMTMIEEPCRRLLVMLYLEESPVPYKEIARTLNIPAGSIGPTRARCLKKLMKLLPN
jgi:RNA polymerase sigma factor (sigma-70 family)